MYGYIRGKVTELDSNYVILENNDIGYLIYVLMLMYNIGRMTLYFVI
jgi:Holliday junction resolvasome RuvABC DNA-binding subunit